MASTSGMRSDYNQNSKIQRDDNRKYLEVLLGALTGAGFKDRNKNEFLHLVDYGCSTGANSIANIKAIIHHLNKSFNVTKFEVMHNDLPSNDFNEVSKALYNDKESYLRLPEIIALPKLVPNRFFWPSSDGFFD
ncbi:class I SAM-dependent methyltransferase [Piscirickettsia litoralis]|uniref:CheR-type methyltransferase domain-containing protein n=1 Tax=Piscirickettsia litoralis TaxID=1891921 RepID=A0ABX3A885_9GAMM|nr:hypothetical protein [Piscirickettsia litoralis]ODN43941.1 hypothetical protein BGC07_14925 [Piscirickettsia litoralis]